MRVFGKDLFNWKKKEDPGELYDFAQHGILNSSNSMGNAPIAYFVTQEDLDNTIEREAEKRKGKKKKKVKKADQPIDVHFTPKGIYEMKSLNAHGFLINRDPEYLKKEIEGLQYKLDFLGKPKNKKIGNGEVIQMFESGAVSWGRKELESMVERLQNRNKIDEFKNIIEKYPHTTTQLISTVLGMDKNLECHKADDFIPDFPREAINAMKEYEDMCLKLCNKRTSFYVLADKKDFEKKNARRDPILFAQSPFGFFWQILGAWDKEMIYLGDL